MLLRRPTALPLAGVAPHPICCPGHSRGLPLLLRTALPPHQTSRVEVVRVKGLVRQPVRVSCHHLLQGCCGGGCRRGSIRAGTPARGGRRRGRNGSLQFGPTSPVPASSNGGVVDLHANQRCRHRLLLKPGMASHSPTALTSPPRTPPLRRPHLFSRCVCRSVVVKVRGSTIVAPAIQAAGSDSRVQSSACWRLAGRRGAPGGGFEERRSEGRHDPGRCKVGVPPVYQPPGSSAHLSAPYIRCTLTLLNAATAQHQQFEGSLCMRVPNCSCEPACA